MSARDRSPAEWVTFGLSLVVLLGVVAVIGLQLRREQEPARPVAVVSGEPRRVGDRYQLDVVVTNEGDATAANVQVSASLMSEGSIPATADQTIDFLAGSEDQDLVFVFADDPAQGELTVEVVSFAVP
jgi:uncharacterized protein (TIGR02588 family)